MDTPTAPTAAELDQLRAVVRRLADSDPNRHIGGGSWTCALCHTPDHDWRRTPRRVDLWEPDEGHTSGCPWAAAVRITRTPNPPREDTQ